MSESSSVAKAEENARLRGENRALIRKISQLERWVARIDKVAKESDFVSAQLLKELDAEKSKVERMQSRLLVLEREAAERQMAGGFAHEMRNALSGAKALLGKGLGELSADGTGLLDENARYLRDLLLFVRERLTSDDARQAGRFVRRISDNDKALDAILREVDASMVRALGITGEIMDYAKLGATHAGASAADLIEAVHGVVAESRPDADARRITIELALEPGPVFVAARDSHLYSMVKNLFLNARDAVCACNDDRARVVSIGVVRDGAQVRLDVTDNGIGIPEQHRPRIFEPFFTTKPKNGTGLGLGVVQKIVHLYGGSIEFKSTENEGSTFTLMLPLMLQAVPETPTDGANDDRTKG